MKATFSILLCLFLASGFTFSISRVEQWKRFEISYQLTPARSTNPFDIKFSARFIHKDTTFNVDGFYDGNNKFTLRFMPVVTGEWKFITSSKTPGLNKLKGTFVCTEATPDNHGIVKVSDVYNFNYADGHQYYPFGTTAYAWTHMGQELQEMTLRTLKTTGFNKIRMCVFPKNYNLVKEEPEIYPYEIKEIKKDEKGNEVKVWDFSKFNPAFFQHLEKRIDDLDKLGIEADLILFHPYDKGRWGFDAMPMEVNLKYLKYIIARLSSYKNLWWSLANEYDYVLPKTDADWDLLSKTVYETDPYRHLCSIHGSTARYYHYWQPWYTHVSIQDEAPVADFGRAAILRNAYYKPVVYDEVCYEGNLKNRWGRYSGEEMTHAVWQGVIAGTYVTHGESYMFRNASDTIFWAKGGKLTGSSWQRIAFLRHLIETSGGPFELADVSRDHKTSTNGKGTYIVYFGKEMPDVWHFNLPAKNAGFPKLTGDKKFKVYMIDTWDMTVTPINAVFETAAEKDYRLYDKESGQIRLPAKPYMALKIQLIP